MVRRGRGRGKMKKGIAEGSGTEEGVEAILKRQKGEE